MCYSGPAVPIRPKPQSIALRPGSRVAEYDTGRVRDGRVRSRNRVGPFTKMYAPDGLGEHRSKPRCVFSRCDARGRPASDEAVERPNCEARVRQDGEGNSLFRCHSWFCATAPFKYTAPDVVQRRRQWFGDDASHALLHCNSYPATTGFSIEA
jgi:hypothetical protein